MNLSNENKLQEIFTAIFDRADDVTKLRRLSESDWDSLANTSLIAAIESEFDIELDWFLSPQVSHSIWRERFGVEYFSSLVTEIKPRDVAFRIQFQQPPE